MVVKQYRQLLVVFYMKPTLLGTEVISSDAAVSSLEDHSEVQLLRGRLHGAHQKVTTDPSSSSYLCFHKEFILFSFLTAAPDVGVLGHSEFLYHMYSFKVYTYI